MDEDFGVLFWNCHRNENTVEFIDAISKIIKSNKVKIVIIAEPARPISELCINLNASGHAFRNVGESRHGHTTISAISTISNEFLSKETDGERFIDLKLKVAARVIRISGVHLLSKASTNEVTRHQVAYEVANKIRIKSETEKHIIIGDFNADPYDSIMTSSSTFNTIFPLDANKKLSYKRSQSNNPKYINLSWPLITNSESVHGTFFFKSKSTNDNCGWSVLDQVIASVEAVTEIINDSVRIPMIDALLTEDFVPNTAEYSDHLPVMFKIRGNHV